jgi:hypothetical protein
MRCVLWKGESARPKGLYIDSVVAVDLVIT